MPNIVNGFEIPSWVGTPKSGLHLDVLKESKLIQKMMIDQKTSYFFGRTKQLNDFCIDHSSCSRNHAVLLWHKHLNRPFLVDLGSTHGTFLGSIRLEKHKPQPVPQDTEIHFGASTRRYVVRERPQSTIQTGSLMGGEKDELEGGLLGLPDTENELDNLTEFNTAHNRRIATMGDLGGDISTSRRKRKSLSICFNEEDEVINPEDIDPNVGKFRNMVSTTVIPNKKPRFSSPSTISSIHDNKRFESLRYTSPAALYTDLPNPSSLDSPNTITSKLGMRALNLAPDVDHIPTTHVVQAIPVPIAQPVDEPSPFEPRKKKYAKESWPGKKPTAASLFM